MRSCALRRRSRDGVADAHRAGVDGLTALASGERWERMERRRPVPSAVGHGSRVALAEDALPVGFRCGLTHTV